MNSYVVTWEIDLEAETPEDAARQARAAQTRPDTLATVFTVTDVDGNQTQVDLTELDELETRP
jgi:hypothetical protein